MINVTELRVGNIVLYTQDNDELPVLKIDGDNKTICLDLLLGLNMQVNEQDIEPIPLTPEWLERMGFVKNTREEWDGPKIELEHSLEWFTIKGYGPDSFMLMGSEWTTGKPFQFVHQLQNLYFALTGEELIIKEAP